MIISILVKKIVSMGLMMALGTLLVKLKLLKAEDSKILSVITLYLIMPCVLITSFQVELTHEVQQGLLLALIAAVAIHVLLVLLNYPLKRLLGLDAVEQTSVIFSNSGNLIVPLVLAILGREWVIYSSAFLAVQMLLLFSYGKGILCDERGLDIKKVITNINMIAILTGLLLLITGIRLPSIITDTMDSFAGMVGPAAMLVTGMLIGSMDLKKLIVKPRLWLIAFLRLIAVPLLIILLLKISGIAGMAENGRSVLLITVLAVITPSASTITQLAQIYDKDAEWASAINVLTTILCICTMPLMIWLYQIL